MVKRLSPVDVISAYDVMSYGAKGDGSTDDTTAIQAAINAANSAGGGIVFFPKATYIASNLTVHGNTTLQGTGRNSVIKAKTSTTGSFIALNTPASDIAVVITDLAIDCNSQSGLSGIYFDNTSVGQDSLHRIINVSVFNAGNDGIHLGPAVIETILLNCYVHNSGRYGYNFDVGATDNRVIGCSSGLSLNHGFYIQGNNTHFIGCKVYYAGYTGSSWTAAIHGFMLYPSASQDLHVVSLISCEAQNNSVDGFHVDGSASSATIQHVSLTNCLADGNNEVVGSGVGFYLNNVRYSTLSDNATRAQSGATQVYGLAAYGNLTGTNIGVNDFNGSTASVYIDSGSSGLFSNSFALPYSAVPSGVVGGIDAPFGSGTARIYSNEAMQLVTANGAFDVYIEESGTQNNVVTWHNTYQDMHSYQIKNVLNPTSAQDAATKTYTDTAVATKVTGSGTTTITVGTSAPGSPSAGDLWVDTN